MLRSSSTSAITWLIRCSFAASYPCAEPLEQRPSVKQGAERF
jgi:hypothetical protein